MKYQIKTSKQNNKNFQEIIYINFQVYAYYKNFLMFSAFNSSKNVFTLCCGTLAAWGALINHPIEYIQI